MEGIEDFWIGFEEMGSKCTNWNEISKKKNDENGWIRSHLGTLGYW